MIQNNMDIVERLRKYQFKMYEGDTMKLSDLK